MTPERKLELIVGIRSLVELVKQVTKAVALLGVIPAKTLFESLEAQGLADRNTFDRLMQLVCATGYVKRDGLVFRRATEAERKASDEATLAELTALETEIAQRREEAEKRG
jgi:hypothetical protein